MAEVCYLLDVSSRLELSDEIITSERDYVSNLTKAIRDIPKNSFSRTFPFLFLQKRYIHSQQLKGPHERAFGCDAMIMIRTNTFLKVGLFEAKWPRISKKYDWDYINKKSGISHFSDQLKRQKHFSKAFAIWEMFLTELPPGSAMPSGFDKYGSTCVLHDEAFLFDSKRGSSTPWNTADLIKMIGAYPRVNRKLSGILLKMLSCKIGKRFNPEINSIEIESPDQPISIPANYFEMGNQIPQFMEQYGLDHFIYLELADLLRFE